MQTEHKPDAIEAASILSREITKRCKEMGLETEEILKVYEWIPTWFASQARELKNHNVLKRKGE